MRDTLAFEYFEVRPCIERDRQVTSYRDENEFAAELARSHKSGREFRTSSGPSMEWTAVPRPRSVTSSRKTPPHEVMNAILAIPRRTPPRPTGSTT